MTEAVTAPGVSEVWVVFLPVTDHDRSLEFFVDRLAFEKRVTADIEVVHATLRARGLTSARR